MSNLRCTDCYDTEGRPTKLGYLHKWSDTPSVLCEDCERNAVVSLAILALKKALDGDKDRASQRIEDALGYLVDVSEFDYDLKPEPKAAAMKKWAVA